MTEPPLDDSAALAAWLVEQGWHEEKGVVAIDRAMSVLELLSERRSDEEASMIWREAMHRVRYLDGAPACPRCHRMPRFIVSPGQAFCGNDDCEVLMWDPSMTDGGISDARTVDLSGLIPLDQPATIRNDGGPRR